MHPHGFLDSLDLNDVSRMLHTCGGEEHGISQLFTGSGCDFF